MTTFIEREAATSGERAVVCFLFRQGANRWFFTQADEPITLPGIGRFERETIRCDAVEFNEEDGTGSLQVYVPVTSVIARLLITPITPERVELTVYRAHADHLDDAEVWWDGRVATATADAPEANLSCVSILQDLQNPVSGMTIGTQCPHILFSPGCGVDERAYTTPATLSGASGSTLSATAFAAHPDGYYTGGKIYPPSGPPIMIVGHVGSSLTTIRDHGLTTGSVVRATAGCPQTSLACYAKFNNIVNALTFDHIPNINGYTQRVLK